MEDENQPYTKLKISNIELVDGKTESATFTFFEEDHTMGNSLRYFLAKNPKVTFAGYSIPHPSDPLMNLRIQTVEGYTAVEALKQALQDLQQVCRHIQTTFQAQVDNQ